MMVLAIFGGLIFVILESFSASLAWRIEKAWYSKERKKIINKFSFVFAGRSYCERCKKPLSVIALIPVIGYFLSRKKCSACSYPVPVRYPVMESMAFLYGMALAYWQPHPVIFLTTAFSYPLLRIMLHIDNRYMLIPTEVLAPFLLVSFMEVSFLRYGASVFDFHPAFALDLSVAFCWYFLFHLLRVLSRNGMGLADVRLTLALTFSLGFPGSFFMPTLAAVIGIAAFLIYRNSIMPQDKPFLRNMHGKTRLAFGGFLILSYWLLRLYPAHEIYL